MFSSDRIIIIDKQSNDYQPYKLNLILSGDHFSTESGVKMQLKAIVLTILIPASLGLTLPRFFGDGMVLQSEPASAQIWGSYDGGKALVQVSVVCQSGVEFHQDAEQVSPRISYPDLFLFGFSGIILGF